AFDGRVAWLQLHPGDNDPRQLGRYLLHVIDAQLAHGCARSLLLAEQGGEVFDTLLTHLLAELPAEHDPLLLVLDDFETLNNPEVIAALRFFLRNMPAWLTLLVCSRGLPELGVADLRVKHQLLTVDAPHLAFETDEVEALLNLSLPVTVNREQVERLNRRIGGWPCALQLALQEVQTGRGMDLFLENLQLGHPYVRDYMREQVTGQLGSVTLEFLQATCLLERFNAPLANRLTQGSNARDMLE